MHYGNIENGPLGLSFKPSNGKSVPVRFQYFGCAFGSFVINWLPFNRGEMTVLLQVFIISWSNYRIYKDHFLNQIETDDH